jgi:flotillin
VWPPPRRRPRRSSSTPPPEAVRAKGMAEAEAIKARGDALAENQDAVIGQQLAEQWPAIVEAAAGRSARLTR